MVPRLGPAVALGDTGIFRLLVVRKVAQGLEAEGREEARGGHTSKRRPVTGPPGARPKQSRSVPPLDRVAADFLAEDLLQRVCQPGHVPDERQRKRDPSGGHSCIISKGQRSRPSNLAFRYGMAESLYRPGTKPALNSVARSRSPKRVEFSDLVHVGGVCKDLYAVAPGIRPRGSRHQPAPPHQSSFSHRPRASWRWSRPPRLPPRTAPSGGAPSSAAP